MMRATFRNRPTACAVALLVLMLAGCGGGTELASTGSGGSGVGPVPPPTAGSTPSTSTPTSTAGSPTTPLASVTKSWSSGPVEADAKLVVSGIAYDASNAAFTDDAGNRRSIDELARGMVVEVEGEVDLVRGTSTATAVRIVRQLAGPVASIDTASNTLTVLGARVRWTDTTLWGDAPGPLSLGLDGSVEVWGDVDPLSATLVATRIVFTARSGPARAPAAGAAGIDPARVRVSGTVTGVSPRELSIGPARVDLSNALVEPGALVVGAQVTVVGTGASDASRVVAERVSLAPQAAGQGAGYATYGGTISTFASLARFTVRGFTVDASRATIRGGTVASIRTGSTVTVSGRVVRDVLVADIVRFGPVDTATDAAPSWTTPPSLDGAPGPGGVGPGPGGGVSPGTFEPGGNAMPGGGAIQAGDATPVGGPSQGGGATTHIIVVDPPAPSVPPPGLCRPPERVRVVVAGATYVARHCASDWRPVSVPRQAGHGAALLRLEHLATGVRVEVVPDSVVSPPGVTAATVVPVSWRSGDRIFSADYGAELWRAVAIRFTSALVANALLTLERIDTGERIETIASRVVGVGGAPLPTSVGPTWPAGIVPDAVVHQQAGWTYVTRLRRDTWRVVGSAIGADRTSALLVLANRVTGELTLVVPSFAIAPDGVVSASGR